MIHRRIMMAIKNVSITISYIAWNSSTDIGQTGDATNHSIYLLQDGALNAATNIPSEVSAANSPGLYKLVLTAAEMNYSSITVCGKSSTPNVYIKPYEILTDQGYLSSITGTGDNTVTLTVLDGSSNPVQGVGITIKNTAQTLKIAGPNTTDINGQLIFNLGDGSYKALISSTNVYQPLAAQTLTVSGTTTATYTLAAYSQGTPSDPTLCRVYGWVTDVNNQPMPSVPILFKLEPTIPADPTAPVETSDYLVSIESLTVKTNREGYFQVDLIRSSQYTPTKDYVVSCEAIGLKATITVPSSASVNLNTLV